MGKKKTINDNGEATLDATDTAGMSAHIGHRVFLCLCLPLVLSCSSLAQCSCPPGFFVHTLAERVHGYFYVLYYCYQC